MPDAIQRRSAQLARPGTREAVVEATVTHEYRVVHEVEYIPAQDLLWLKLAALLFAFHAGMLALAAVMLALAG